MKSSTLVYGTDPEFFAGYMRENKLYCLPPVFFRTRLDVPFTPNGRHPIFIEDTDNDTIIHEDGAAFEMALRPTIDWKDLVDRVRKGKRLLENAILNKFTSECDGKVHTLPTIGYDVERWKDEGDEFKMCTLFGCDPDADAFNTERDCFVIDASLHPERYGGGHIHISGSKAIKDEPIKAVHSLALTVGLAAVAFSDTPELDKQRTYLYGKPGKYRIQSYGKTFHKMPYTNVGIEYRTPSNRWTEVPTLSEKIFEWAEVGIHYLLEGDLISKVIRELREPACDAIINCNQSQARDILNRIEALA